MEKWIHDKSTSMAVVHGCMVNLRTHAGELMGRSWRIESTLASFAKDLHLICQHDTKHATCEGCDTRHTTYYTPEFAKRVCRLMLRYPELPAIDLAISEEAYLAAKSTLLQVDKAIAEGFTLGHGPCCSASPTAFLGPGPGCGCKVPGAHGPLLNTASEVLAQGVETPQR